MDNSLLYVLMLIAGVLMASLPWLVFMGFGTLFGITSIDYRLLLTFVVLALVVTFAVSFIVFMMIQKNNCGQVKDYGKISTYAGISTGIQAGVLTLVSFIQWFKSIVLNIVPPDLDNRIQESIVYSYYSFWAILFGIALGGNMSAIC
jgi:hypothetical protein